MKYAFDISIILQAHWFKNVLNLFYFFLLTHLNGKSLFSNTLGRLHALKDSYKNADSSVVYKNVTIRNIMRSNIKF